MFIGDYCGFGYYRGVERMRLEDACPSCAEPICGQDHIRRYCHTQLYDLYGEGNVLLEFGRKTKLGIVGIREDNTGEERT